MRPMPGKVPNKKQLRAKVKNAVYGPFNA